MDCKKALLAAVSGGVMAVGVPSADAASVLTSLAANIPGGLTFQLTNFDMGAQYPDLGAGGTAGTSASNQDEVNAGITALNELQSQGGQGATGAYNPDGSALGNEDSWGIFRINNIQDHEGNIVWSATNSDVELTAIFYGERDHYISQAADGTQTIEGTNLHVDIYQDSAQNYDPTQGSGGRTALDQYNTATDGTEVLKLISEAGHINDPGENGGPESSFRSFFDPLTGADDISAKGLSFLSVIGGEDADAFDTNTFGVSDENAALGYVAADIKAEFSINSTDVGDWLVRSNDPLSTFPAVAAVPTPTAAVLGLAMLGGLGLRRRRATC